MCQAVRRQTVGLVLSLFFQEKAAEHGVRACLVASADAHHSVVRAGSFWWDMGASAQIPSWFS